MLSTSATAATDHNGNTERTEKFFSTDHLKADLKRRFVHGGVVTMAAQGMKFSLQMGSTVVLARLLTPEDYGLIAMVSVFTEFINLFKNLGLSMATIQKKDITHQQVSTLFWVNIGMSCLLMLIAATLSSFVAWFYDEPRLRLITIAIGSTFIFGGLIAQHTALMHRQMRFGALAVIEIVSMTAGIAAAVIAALSGLTYWSLVIMTAVRGAVSVIMIWSQSPWRPGKPVRGSGVRPMLAFGGSLTGSNIVAFFTEHSDNLIIGYALGSAALGIYTKAYALLTLPMSQFNTPLHTIMMPTLSRLQEEPERYRQFYLRTLAGIALITMPIVGFLFVSADEIVNILLGSQWTAVTATFRYLGPAAFLCTISHAPGLLFISLGRAGVALRWNMLTAPVIIIGFLIGIHWGINGVAVSFSITYSVLMVLGLVVASYKSPVRFYDIIEALAVPATCSLLAALGATLLGRFVPESNVVVRLSICGLIFCTCYCGCVLMTSAGRQLVRSMIEALSSLRGKPIETITG